MIPAYLNNSTVWLRISIPERWECLFRARIFPAEACRSFARPGAGTSIWFGWSPTTTGVENLNLISMEGRGNSHDPGQLEFTAGPFQIDIRSKTGESQ